MTDPFNSSDSSFIYRESSSARYFYRVSSAASDTFHIVPKPLRWPRIPLDETLEKNLTRDWNKVGPKERGREG